MREEMWFVGCIENDCTAVALGPFFDVDLAHLECEADCPNAHGLFKGLPGPDIDVCPPMLIGMPMMSQLRMDAILKAQNWLEDHAVPSVARLIASDDGRWYNIVERG